MPAPPPESEPATVIAFATAGESGFGSRVDRSNTGYLAFLARTDAPLVAVSNRNLGQMPVERRQKKRPRLSPSAQGKQEDATPIQLLLPFLRRHDPDQVQRVGGLLTALSALRAPLATVKEIVPRRRRRTVGPEGRCYTPACFFVHAPT